MKGRIATRSLPGGGADGVAVGVTAVGVPVAVADGLGSAASAPTAAEVADGGDTEPVGAGLQAAGPTSGSSQAAAAMRPRRGRGGGLTDGVNAPGR